MKRITISIAGVTSILAAGALAAGAAASSAGGPAVVTRDAGCVTNVFATTCTTIKTVTNETVTPSGNVSYVTNGSVERTVTFSFGGTFTSNSALHGHILAKKGEIATGSEHYAQVDHYVSGTYELSCVSSYDIHFANGDTQFGNYELSCTTP